MNFAALFANPTLRALLISLGPAAFSGLFSSPQQDLQRQVQGTLSPEHIQNLANIMEKNLTNSAGFSGAQTDIARGVSSLTNRLNRSLAARGLDTSGVGAVASSLAGSAGGFALGNLRSSAAEAALRSAQTLAQGQANALLQGGAIPNPRNQLLGSGFRALIPYLLSTLGKSGNGGNINWAQLLGGGTGQFSDPNYASYGLD